MSLGSSVYLCLVSVSCEMGTKLPPRPAPVGESGDEEEDGRAWPTRFVQVLLKETRECRLSLVLPYSCPWIKGAGVGVGGGALPLDPTVTGCFLSGKVFRLQISTPKCTASSAWLPLHVGDLCSLPGQGRLP